MPAINRGDIAYPLRTINGAVDVACDNLTVNGTVTLANPPVFGVINCTSLTASNNVTAGNSITAPQINGTNVTASGVITADSLSVTNNVTAATLTTTTLNVGGNLKLNTIAANSAVQTNGSGQLVGINNTGTGLNVLQSGPTFTGTVSIPNLTVTGLLDYTAQFGSYVPQYNNTTGAAITYTSRTGNYQIIGKICMVNIKFNTSSALSTTANSVAVSLPFPSFNVSSYLGTVEMDGWTLPASTDYMNAAIFTDINNINFAQTRSAANGLFLTYPNTTVARIMYCSIIYRLA